MKDEINELKKMVENFLNKKKSLDELYQFSWEKINFYAANKDLSPTYNEDEEGKFWYAIWQIQHLADSEHEKEGLLQRELINIINILENKKKLQKKYFGKRP